jgi:hypothetical protein
MESAALHMKSPRPWNGASPAAEPPALEFLPWGFPELDALTGGLLRGGLTVIAGPASSGRTSLALSLLAQMTAREEICAWVDASHSFDPGSAQMGGADLRRLLWVRSSNVEQAFPAADLLLHSGGFGLVVLDLGDIPPSALHRVPLSFWFRFRHAIERTPTALLVLEQEPAAKSCASLVLRLQRKAVHWSVMPNASVKPARLLRAVSLCAEVIRSRLPIPPATMPPASFSVRTPWNFPNEAWHDR